MRFIPLLDTTYLKSCIVTMDVIGCQTEIAQKMVDQSGDCLLAVKDNQEKLVNAVREFFTDEAANGFGLRPVSGFSILEDHDQIETRTVCSGSRLLGAQGHTPPRKTSRRYAK